MSTLQQYANSWTDRDVDNEIDAANKDKGEDSEFLSIKDGEEAVFRVIPNPKGGGPIVRFRAHQYKDRDTQKFVRFPCPGKSTLPDFKNYECPVCKEAAMLRQRGRPKADNDYGYEMRAKPRALMGVLERPTDQQVQDAMDEGLEPPEGKIKVWEFSSWAGRKNGKNMHERLLATRQDTRLGGNFADPTAAGFDLLLKREGEGMETNYTLGPLLADKKPLLPTDEASMKLIMEDQLPLQYYVLPPTHEDLCGLLQGEGRSGGGSSLGSGQAASNMSLGAGTTESLGEVVEADYGTSGRTGKGF